MKTDIVIDVSPSGKILGLALWVQMLLSNQIAGFFEMYNAISQERSEW